MSEFRIKKNERVAENIYELLLEGDVRGMTRPGQFVTLVLPGFFLRRPLSVADWSDHALRMFYKVVGKGTEALRNKSHGTLDVMTGIGNGFDLDLTDGKVPVLIGGGVGVPPLFGLAKAFLAQHIQPTVILGFNQSDEIFLADEFEEMGCDVRIATVDGSVGIKGFVTDALAPLIDEKGGEALYIYTCGPMPMFHALAAQMNAAGIDGSFSLEERMGCAMGICLGCTIQTKEGPRRVCQEGPVFKKEVLPWA